MRRLKIFGRGHPYASYYGKIAEASPLQFSMELLKMGASISFLLWEHMETRNIHKLIIMEKLQGRIAGALPLQFSGELLESGGIHDSSYWKNSRERIGGIYDF